MKPSRRARALILVLAGVVWALVNGPVEGPVLITFTPSMGLTVADLLSIALFAAAAVVWWRPRQPGRPGVEPGAAGDAGDGTDSTDSADSPDSADSVRVNASS